MKIFVISLPEEKAKKESIKKQMAKFSLDYEFINGVRYEESMKGYFTPNCVSYCSKASKGIAIAHLNALKYATRTREDTIILEDDAILQPNFKDDLNLIHKYLQTHDYIKLHCYPNRDCATCWTWKQANNGGNKYKRINDEIIHPTTLYGTPGYAVSKRSALKILKLSEKVNTAIDDHFNSLYQSGKIRAAQPIKPLVEQTFISTDNNAKIYPKIDNFFDKIFNCNDRAGSGFTYNMTLSNLEYFGFKYNYANIYTLFLIMIAGAGVFIYKI